MAFSEQYKTGQVVELQDDECRQIATAIVLDFDPTRSKRTVSGMSKAGRSSPDHWHVAVQEFGAVDWLPAAIWEDENPEGRFGLHITREHIYAELRDKPLVYTVEELEQRIGNVAMQVSQMNSMVD
jgi:hypothetical protein